MGQSATASAEDERPVLATYDLASCIGVVLYDEEHRQGFVRHAVKNDAVDGRDPQIDEFYAELAGSDDEHDLTATYVFGNVPDSDVLETVHETVHDAPENVSISAERGVYAGRSGNVALDTRTGELFSYDKTQHPDFESLF